VVGAGVAGLGAARLLAKAGHEVVVYEGAGEVGGRCATRQVDQFVFDTGATSIAGRGRQLEHVMLNELDTSDLLRVAKPIYTHHSLRVSQGEPGKMKIDRYTYRAGNATLPKLLASGLDVRRHDEIHHMEKNNGTYSVNGEEFDAAILAMPLPETVRLLQTLEEQRPISHVHYRACISVLLGYQQPMPEVHYHALMDPEQRHPLTWLSIESVKSPGRAPEGQTAMVAQLSPQFSAMHYGTEDGGIVSATVEYIERLYGEAWGTPAVFDVKRWQYSQPENLALFDNVNHSDARLLIASDGLVGGRVEYAYEAGARAAKILIDSA
jgi:renalase